MSSSAGSTQPVDYSPRDFRPPWRQGAVSSETALSKMIKNIEKAYREHGFDRIPEEIKARIRDEKPLDDPLKCSVTSDTQQGRRPGQEDAYFHRDLGDGYLAGVLDGHGNHAVADYVAKQFPDRFSIYLKDSNNIFAIFERIVSELNRNILAIDDWTTFGATAVVVYVDVKSGIAYTMTIGDSEARVYRGGTEIPLSCVRNWISPKDRARAEGIYGAEKLRDVFKADPKMIRFPIKGLGMNVGRAFGDAFAVSVAGKPLIIAKPKITAHPIQRGDTIVLASDGLWDVARKADLVCSEKKQGEGPTPGKRIKIDAAALTQYALAQPRASDNVTAICMQIA